MRTMSASRVAQAAAGLAVLAIPSSAYAVSTTQQAGHGQAQPTHLNARPASATVAYGQNSVVRGYASPRLAGSRMTLLYEPAGTGRWQAVAKGRLGADGRFTLRAALPRSGRVRVAALPTAGPSAPEAPSRGASRARPVNIGTQAHSGHPAAPTQVESPTSQITVGAAFHIASRIRSAVAGRPVELMGWLLPGTAGRRVQLEARTGTAWAQVATARTGRFGGFRLRFSPHSAGTQRLRVSFRGDRANRGASAPAGSAVTLIPAVASWYYDAGNTACGFHARYGIANRTLPCGSQVTLSYGGRTVEATVDDRGPFVYGREYDLNQTTAAALGMFGVATVLASA